MEAKIIKFETGQDKIKGKILIEEKEVEINQRFKTTFIINKDILNYKEDLIAYIAATHTYREDEHSNSYLSVAKQVKIPFNTYKEYDEENVSYEVEIYIPEYNEYIYNIKHFAQPRISARRCTTLSEEQYKDIRCKVGIMRESELYAPNLSKVIKEKDVLLVGQKSFLFNFFRAILTFLIYSLCIISMPYISSILPFNDKINMIIPFIIYGIVLVTLNTILDKIFRVRPKK